MNDIKDEKNMFNQISFADKLIVEDMLENEDKSKGEGTSEIGSYAKFISQLKLILHKVKAPIAGRLRKCHSFFIINRSKCDAESRIAANILMYVSSLL